MHKPTKLHVKIFCRIFYKQLDYQGLVSLEKSKIIYRNKVLKLVYEVKSYNKFHCN